MTVLDIRKVNAYGRRFYKLLIRRPRKMPKKRLIEFVDFIVQEDGSWRCSNGNSCLHCKGIQACIRKQLLGWKRYGIS
jgi:hypothetical protein